MIFTDDITEKDRFEVPEFETPELPAMPRTTNAWKADTRTQKDSEIFLYELARMDNTFDPGTYFDGNKDIAEVMRDEDNRIMTIIQRAGNLDELSPRGKQALVLK